MKIPILIEPISAQRYRATVGEPLGGIVEAETPDAALARMKELIDDRLSGGARIAALDVPDSIKTNPWLDGAGMFRDDPLFDDWQRAIADYRREANEIAFILRPSIFDIPSLPPLSSLLNTEPLNTEHPVPSSPPRRQE
jgi:hypothetical protein